MASKLVAPGVIGRGTVDRAHDQGRDKVSQSGDSADDAGSERSLGWLVLRRPARDYETLPASSEAMIHIASIDNLAERITDETAPTRRGTY